MFQNEANHLPAMLDSLAHQTRPPDLLLLVDDGSTDRSAQIARDAMPAFPEARLLQRRPRPPARDRLSSAAVWTAFQWAVAQAGPDFDVVAKVDADLCLGPRILEDIATRFERDHTLGITGPYLSELGDDGRLRRLEGRPEHVAGAVKFYRRECFDQVFPLPPLLNLDMVDEAKARSLRWRTESFTASDGDPLHARRQGSHDGSLRAYRRWGEGDYISGSHPLLVAFVGIRRLAERPLLLAGLNYFAGWAGAALRRADRFDREIRRFRQHEQLLRVRARLTQVITGRRRPPAPMA
ncbi:MAG: poly-beta,6-N-acetyl-D-glucosamine synthase [Nocardioidaceae bacterium]|jgi:hypothetical protein|nr:poly-beta,6-N-acetyl-D-glucosamine synthase [Nocardioidaceae bacterium]